MSAKDFRFVEFTLYSIEIQMIVHKLSLLGLLGEMLHGFASLGSCAEVDKHIFVETKTLISANELW